MVKNGFHLYLDSDIYHAAKSLKLPVSSICDRALRAAIDSGFDGQSKDDVEIKKQTELVRKEIQKLMVLNDKKQAAKKQALSKTKQTSEIIEIKQIKRGDPDAAGTIKETA